MRRVKICIFLLVFLILFAVAACLFVDAATDRMLGYLALAQQQSQGGEYPALAVTLEELQAYYDAREWALSLLLRRDYATAPAISFSALQSYANEEYRADFEAELRRSRAQLLVLRQIFLRFF